MTHNEIKERIEAAWNSRERKIDHLAMETLLVEALRQGNLGLAKEVVDSFTRRGYFKTDEYAN